ncbi:hypothetical protein CXG81DRAFT_28406 [Caulochytrium protostelioides]|uniref:Uncharacterized protein n=1 Tax=Caulochytrium protostelioides TaxID=1555241 RepID=A0A4P9X2J7_9FUNG|nr:hypothetical protein CXG81DRAFT_28406 [Caulochytrium protostelioides]|eukprot:RKO98800.1 hypothetical protein CXG81DRAFT_28406 [Caulochytrium protostelioides]
MLPGDAGAYSAFAAAGPAARRPSMFARTPSGASTPGLDRRLSSVSAAQQEENELAMLLLKLDTFLDDQTGSSHAAHPSPHRHGAAGSRRPSRREAAAVDDGGGDGGGGAIDAIDATGAPAIDRAALAHERHAMEEQQMAAFAADMAQQRRQAETVALSRVSQLIVQVAAHYGFGGRPDEAPARALLPRHRRHASLGASHAAANGGETTGAFADRSVFDALNAHAAPTAASAAHAASTTPASALASAIASGSRRTSAMDDGGMRARFAPAALQAPRERPGDGDNSDSGDNDPETSDDRHGDDAYEAGRAAEADDGTCGRPLGRRESQTETSLSPAAMARRRSSGATAYAPSGIETRRASLIPDSAASRGTAPMVPWERVAVPGARHRRAAFPSEIPVPALLRGIAETYVFRQKTVYPERDKVLWREMMVSDAACAAATHLLWLLTDHLQRHGPHVVPTHELLTPFLDTPFRPPPPCCDAGASPRAPSSIPAKPHPTASATTAPASTTTACWPSAGDGDVSARQAHYEALAAAHAALTATFLTVASGTAPGKHGAPGHGAIRAATPAIAAAAYRSPSEALAACVRLRTRWAAALGECAVMGLLSAFGQPIRISDHGLAHALMDGPEASMSTRAVGAALNGLTPDSDDSDASDGDGDGDGDGDDDGVERRRRRRRLSPVSAAAVAAMASAEPATPHGDARVYLVLSAAWQLALGDLVERWVCGTSPGGAGCVSIAEVVSDMGVAVPVPMLVPTTPRLPVPVGGRTGVPITVGGGCMAAWSCFPVTAAAGAGCWLAALGKPPIGLRARTAPLLRHPSAAARAKPSPSGRSATSPSSPVVGSGPRVRIKAPRATRRAPTTAPFDLSRPQTVAMLQTLPTFAATAARMPSHQASPLLQAHLHPPLAFVYHHDRARLHDEDATDASAGDGPRDADADADAGNPDDGLRERRGPRSRRLSGASPRSAGSRPDSASAARFPSAGRARAASRTGDAAPRGLPPLDAGRRLPRPPHGPAIPEAAESSDSGDAEPVSASAVRGGSAALRPPAPSSRASSVVPPSPPPPPLRRPRVPSGRATVAGPTGEASVASTPGRGAPSAAAASRALAAASAMAAAVQRLPSQSAWRTMSPAYVTAPRGGVTRHEVRRHESLTTV